MIVSKSRAIRKGDLQEEALRRLHRFLSLHEGRLKEILYRDAQRNQQAISYWELRDMLLTNTISPQFFSAWQQSYALFVSEVLDPVWTEAARAAAQSIQREHPGFFFDPFSRKALEWTEQRAAELVTNCTEEIKAGVRAAVKRSVYGGELGVDELSRVVRPMIGLTKPQVRANQNYYLSLRSNGMKAERAAEKAAKYAARQHRYRAGMIARTESAFAYNRAEYEVIRQAQEEGYFRRVSKIWCTAGDERTCEVCGALNGAEIEMTEFFDFPTKLSRTHGYGRVPPAHPHCRCTVLYVES